MLFNWFRDRRRRKLLEAPWPESWQQILTRNVAFTSYIPALLQPRLRDIARILIAEKFWEGCAGLVITEEIQVTIAIQAAILLLELEHDYYARVPTILVYPSSFRTATADDNADEAFVPGRPAMGEAVYRGPVILAWDEVLDHGRHPELGHNVVLHEFAHQLDFLDNSVDGVPPLATFQERRRWLEVMSEALEKHRESLTRHRNAIFNAQTAESRTELFAYATEVFYCTPMKLAAEYPDVYELLQGYYRVDPRKWLP